MSDVTDKITVAEAARLLGVSRGTVRRWAARKRLRAWRQGQRLIVVALDDVEHLRREVEAYV